jgi:hypothetical protein
MTKIEKPLYTTKEQNRRLMLRVLALGLIAGMILTLSLATAQQPESSVEAINQQHQMYKACKLPDIDGAMTVFAMEDGKLKCWRWK